jgi:site-specific recombinase XerC
MGLAQRGPTTAVEAVIADPVRRLLAAFLVGYEGHTRAAYARDLADWLAFCARHGIEPLAAHRAHVDAYARDLAETQGRARSTVARRLSALAGFYGYALDEDLIDRSPLGPMPLRYGSGGGRARRMATAWVGGLVGWGQWR